MSIERIEEIKEEIWEILRDTDKRIQELSITNERIEKQISDLTGSWGKFVEAMVEPALVRLFSERGIEIEGTQQRAKRRRNGDEMEIDHKPKALVSEANILGINKEWIVAVEVKTTLKVEDVVEHEGKLRRLKEFFPEYADRKVIGAVAGMRMEEGADRYAYRRGLFVLAQSGETVKILNDEKFQPKVWI